MDPLRPFMEAVPDDGSDGGTGYEDDDEVDVEPEPEPEPQASWSPSQEEWERLTQFMGQAAPLVAEIARERSEMYTDPGPQPPSGEDFDPFDPDSVQNYIQESVQYGVTQALQQNFAPYEGVLGMVASQQGEALARQELEKIQGEIGEFDHDSAFLVASGMIEQGVDPVRALRQAAGYARETEERIRADERERYKSELQKLASAPTQAPAGSANGDQIDSVPTGKGRYEEAVRRALANRTPMFPTG